MQDFGDRIVVAGPDGTTTLTGIEHLQFADGTITPDHANPLFDKLYYLSHNIDVFLAGVDPLWHYNTFGWHEGRDPNALFDTSGYLAINKDVAAAGINPLDHYHQSGWHEGRDPSGSFDTLLYPIHNPDVAAIGMDPLAHYLAFGRPEGRAIYAAVGPRRRRLRRASTTSGTIRTLRRPASTRCSTTICSAGTRAAIRTPGSTRAGYLSHYADVAAAGVNPLAHYRMFGWHEGRDPRRASTRSAISPPIPTSRPPGVDPLAHYLQFGIYEGRAVVNDGAWH